MFAASPFRNFKSKGGTRIIDVLVHLPFRNSQARVPQHDTNFGIGALGMAVVSGRARAPYAADPEKTRGRLHPEPSSSTRNPYRRDCDRIIHASAFRRLKHKTQVFIFDEGDHYRTRLTHTLEVT